MTRETDTPLGPKDERPHAMQNTIPEREPSSPKAPQEKTAGTGPQATVVIRNLRTFQGDVAEAIKNQNSSILSIAMAEQAKANRGEAVKAEPPPEPVSFVERIMGKRRAPRPMAIEPKAQARPSLESRMAAGLTRQFEKPAQATYEAPKAPPIAPRPFPPAVPAKLTALASSAPPIPSIPVPQEKSEKPETPAMQMPTRAPKVGSRIILSPNAKKEESELRKNVLTIVVSITLILLGITTVAGFYFIQKKGASTVAEDPSEKAILSYDKREVIPADGLSREELIRQLDAIRREENLPEGDILYLTLADEGAESVAPINTAELFSILDTQMPASLLRAMNSEFMLGMYAHLGNQPFLIVSLASFENSFDGMLRWEKTMNVDIGSIFSPRTIPITEIITEETGTSTEATTTAVTRIVNVDIDLQSKFEDLTVRNKDARVLKNTRGDTLMLYSFLDQNTLLITSSEGAFQEILSAFLAEKLIR